MATMKSRARLFADLQEKPKNDYDPEADAPVEHGEEPDSSDGEEVLAGTEHYVSVGKSKLRKKEPVSLGPQYKGVRVSREVLEGGEKEHDDLDGEDSEEEGEEPESGEYADPDEADLEADQAEADEDAEIDSDEAFGESDEERFMGFAFRGSSRPTAVKGKRLKRPMASDFLSSSGDEEASDGEGVDLVSEKDEDEGQSGEDEFEEMDSDLEDDEEDEEDNGDEDQDEEEDGDEDEDGIERENGDAQRAELRKIMNEGQKTVLATMSQAARADAEKGLAVRQQRRSFDSLLNLRIRLQKALVAVNSIGTLEDDQVSGQEPYEAAEQAAVKLLNTIGTFRDSLLPTSSVKAGQKRKREAEVETPSQSIWDDMMAAEERAFTHRRKALDKWSTKVRGTTAVATTRNLGTTTAQSLVSVLDDHLLNTDRLVQRTRTPRSCAPVQATRKVGEDASVFDDADFYQLLLKELVDQRSTDMSGPGAAATVKWAALKEAKTRKQVDRRASKGRKLRFNVHEKIQNFMAPEDRRTWEQHAIDRFFGTLFGQKMMLGEEEVAPERAGSDDDDDEDEPMGGVELGVGSLRLFRS